MWIYVEKMNIEKNLFITNTVNGHLAKIHAFCKNTKRWIVLLSATNHAEETAVRLTESSILEFYRESSAEEENIFHFPFERERWLYLSKYA